MLLVKHKRFENVPPLRKRKTTILNHGMALSNAVVRKNTMFYWPEHFRDGILRERCVTFKVTTTSGIRKFKALNKLADFICKHMHHGRRFDLTAVYEATLSFRKPNGKYRHTPLYVIKEILFHQKKGNSFFGREDIESTPFQFKEIIKKDNTYEPGSATFGFAQIKSPERYIEITKLAFK